MKSIQVKAIHVCFKTLRKPCFTRTQKPHNANIENKVQETK